MPGSSRSRFSTCRAPARPTRTDCNGMTRRRPPVCGVGRGTAGFALLLVLWTPVLIAFLVMQLSSGARSDLGLATNLQPNAAADAQNPGGVAGAVSGGRSRLRAAGCAVREHRRAEPGGRCDAGAVCGAGAAPDALRAGRSRSKRCRPGGGGRLGAEPAIRADGGARSAGYDDIAGPGPSLWARQCACEPRCDPTPEPVIAAGLCDPGVAPR